MKRAWRWFRARPAWQQIAAWVVLGIIVIVAAFSGGDEAASPTRTVTQEANAPTPTQTQTQPARTQTQPTQTQTQPTRTATEPTTTEPAGSAVAFSDGSHRVPQDVRPGTYRAADPSSFCYWERLSGFGGTLGDIISNENTSYPTVVTISSSDAGFEASGCGDWTADLKQVTNSKTEFGPGTYIVGTDIEPGTYRSNGGETCYWARLSGFGGTLGDIIANDNPPVGPLTVTISASDRGFSSNDCGTFRRT